MRKLVVVLAVVALIAVGAPHPASASVAAAAAPPAPSQAVCVGEWFDTVTPGVSLTPTTARFTSNGQTGSITCVGSVKGHTVTGPGRIGEQGEATGTCAAGSGTGTLFITLPTDAGQLDLILPTMFSFVGGVGTRTSTVFPGGFLMAPTEGDCIVTPATQIAIVLHGTLTLS